MPVINLPFTLPEAEKEFPFGFDRVWFDRPRVVLERGEPGTWNAFGVRDPCLLMDEDGHLVREKDHALVMYYTGSSHPQGSWQATGRAVSHDNGWSWQHAPDGPVLEPRPGGWDALVTSTSWVMRTSGGIYRLYYRGLSRHLENEACGLAESHDGIHFERYGDRPILRQQDFADQPRNGRGLLGVIHVARLFDGRYFLTFEGLSATFGDRACIFGAVSEDGRAFEPFNGGYPVFTPKDAAGWRVKRVANPRLTVLPEQGLYLLGYNGHFENGHYAVGFAVSDDLIHWFDHPGNPLIWPSMVQAHDPFSGRIEGPVLVKEDLRKRDEPIRCFVMSIPAQSSSFHGGVIGLSLGWRNRFSHNLAFSSVADQAADVTLSVAEREESTDLWLQRSQISSFPTRVHFSLVRHGQWHRVSLEIMTTCQRHEGYIVLAEEPDLAGRSTGVCLRMRHGELAWSRGIALRQRPWMLRKLRGLIRRLSGRQWFFSPGRWRSLGKLVTGQPMVVAFEPGKQGVDLAVNGCRVTIVQGAHWLGSTLQDLSVQCMHGRFRVRHLQITTDAH